MTSFNTKRNKLNYIQNQSQKDKIDTLRQQEKNNNLKNDLNASIYHLQKFITDLSFDWEDLDTNIAIDEQYKNWTIEFPIFDIRLLPFIDIKILYRRGFGIVQDDKTIVPYIQQVCLIENIAKETSIYIKKITFKISLYFSYNGLNEIYQAKANITFINPRNY
jgi:hypothetical protein